MGNIFGGHHHNNKTGGGNKKKRGKHPKKRQRSRTRRNRLDFVTHLGDGAFNARGHRQYRKRRPYTRKKRS